MMRRARWLLIGAMAGIAAYRRLGRALRGSRGSLPGPALRGSRGSLPGPFLRPRRALGVIPFLRDVRAGMAEYADLREVRARRYFDRRIQGPGNTLASHVTDKAKDGP